MEYFATSGPVHLKLIVPETSKTATLSVRNITSLVRNRTGNSKKQRPLVQHRTGKQQLSTKSYQKRSTAATYGTKSYRKKQSSAIITENCTRN